MARGPAVVVLPTLPPIPLTPTDESLVASLTVTEKVILAQAIHASGTASKADGWKVVAKVMHDHAMLQDVGKGKGRAGNGWNAEKCERVYVVLMKELGYDELELYPANAPVLLALAKKYYLQRVVELREHIQLESDRFKITFAEIEEIKQGKWDHRIDGASTPSVEVDEPPLGIAKDADTDRESEEVLMEDAT